MRLPRSVSGKELIKSLRRIGYEITRQTGSHVRMTCEKPEQHRITIPKHPELRVGTLSAILADIAAHRKITREELIKQLFG